MFDNELIEFKQPHANVNELKDEYDVNEMRDTLQKYHPTIVTAILPGSGKTTTIKKQ